MIPQTCLVVDTSKFPILDDEPEVTVNEGTYGKAFCLYLQAKLPEVGIHVPRFCCEDWGWRIEVRRDKFKMALCVYSESEASRSPERYAILPSISNAKLWSWKRLSFLDASESVRSIMDQVAAILQSDPEIRSVTRHDEFPL